ncbi:hypothetical protein T06_7914 [Trichinella sp. T6]|nr:hypothetical protein T06_7914 [Trichinella sp. T6]
MQINHSFYLPVVECRRRASEREREGCKEECSREGDVESREQRRENSRQQQKKKKYKCFVEWFYLRELTRFNVIKVVSLGRTSCLWTSARYQRVGVNLKSNCPIVYLFTSLPVLFSLYLNS